MHIWKAQKKAQSMGAFAGEDCADKLWHLSKRELLEIALRLTMAETAEEAVRQVKDEHTTLKQNGLI